MSIQGLGNNSPIQKITTNPLQKAIQPGSAQPERPADTVELTSISQHLATLKSLPDIRADKVADIKAQIASGNYADDDQKLDAAIDKLIEDL